MNTSGQPKNRLPLSVIATVIFILMLISQACDSIGGNNQANVETMTAKGVEATVLAKKAAEDLQATTVSQQATQAAQEAQAKLLAEQAAQLTAQAAPPTADQVATQVANLVKQTADAQQTEMANLAPVVTEPPTATQAPPPTTAPEATATPDFKSFMKSAKILLYEDMVASPSAGRYVKGALDAMGLSYIDTGNAMGRLKTNMLSGGPEGKGWDLVIIAAERKDSISGEFFTYVNDALNQGSSVILEVWYLDKVGGGTASTILARCGIEFQKDWANVPVSREVMYPVIPDHPILHEPNDSLSFTKVTDYWADIYDLGDLVRNNNMGDAVIVVGTLPTEKQSYGTLTVCENGQLIIQTYSTHQLAHDYAVAAWQNFIHHALKSRLAAISQE